MTRCYCETNLVVKLTRGRDVAFLLNMKSHAAGTGRNVATIRTGGPGDNPLFVLISYDSSEINLCDRD